MSSPIVNLLQSALRFPHRVAVRLGDTVLTFAQLEEHTARVVALLRAEGVTPGSRVAVMLPNVPEFVVLSFERPYRSISMSTFTSSDGTIIHVREWLPTDREPIGIVQIAHGMGEFAGRYAHLAERLAGLGYAVYANDHRGHGHSIAGTPGDLGANGWNLLVEDLATLTKLLRDKHSGIPVVLFGHSLGSFAVQQYILDHSGLIDDVVLCGTTAVDQLFARIAESDGDLLGLFNARFQPTRTTADWISRDEAQVDAYMTHPWCGFEIDPDNMALLASVAAERLSKPTTVPADLPIYVMVGDQDPLNDDLRLSNQLIARYRDAGLTDITYRVYGGARHEILNEINRDEVEDDLIAWIARVSE
ncbi:alpha/beta fold hydrolase [Nocardia sp. NPDC059246]|uniref:alpha/beta fold hydrolase n=1 Tax=unclassified Nocardia TaxID=2637762 RepID=UPI0036737DAB